MTKKPTVPKPRLGARMRIYIVKIVYSPPPSKPSPGLRCWWVYGFDLDTYTPAEPPTLKEAQKSWGEPGFTYELVETYDLAITDLFQLAQIEQNLRNKEESWDVVFDPLGSLLASLLNQFRVNLRWRIEEVERAEKSLAQRRDQTT